MGGSLHKITGYGKHLSLNPALHKYKSVHLFSDNQVHNSSSLFFNLAHKIMSPFGVHSHVLLW